MKKGNTEIPEKLRKKYLIDKTEPARHRIEEAARNNEPVVLGRSYRNTFPNLAFRYCLLGADNKLLGDFFGVTDATIVDWKQLHPLFKEAIDNGSVVADSFVAEAIYNRALGYNAKEERISVVDGQVVVTEVMKHYPADIAAGKFWLSNRQSDKWRITPEIELNARLNVYKPEIKRFDGSIDAEELEAAAIIEGCVEK